jgi:hypothetical protein
MGIEGWKKKCKETDPEGGQGPAWTTEPWKKTRKKKHTDETTCIC